MLSAKSLGRSLILLFIACVSVSLVQAQTNRGFLWQVSSPHSTVYLLGSVHFANAAYYPLSPATQQAFKEADALVVEVDMTSMDPLQTRQLIQKMSTYQDGRTLKDVLRPATYRRLTDYLARQQIPLQPLQQQKPGMLIMSLTSLKLLEHGMSPQYGIDLHFLSRAQGSKRIEELESLEQQLALLMDLDNPDQAIAQTLDEFAHYGELSMQLFKAWQQGNTNALERLLIEEPLAKYPESKPYFEKLFTQRNRTMSRQIKAYLNDKDTYFVVVGAGHLVGDQGIIALLEKAGYRARQL